MTERKVNEIKDEPRCGAGCEADAFMNWPCAELLQRLNLYNLYTQIPQ